MTEDSPCLALSDKSAPLLAVLMQERTGPLAFQTHQWKEQPLPFKTRPRHQSPDLHYHSQGPPGQGGTRSNLPLSCPPTPPWEQDFLIFPTSKTQWGFTRSKQTQTVPCGRKNWKSGTHFTRVIPAHLYPRVQVGGRGAVEDKSLTVQQSHGAWRPYADI